MYMALESIVWLDGVPQSDKQNWDQETLTCFSYSVAENFWGTKILMLAIL